MPTEHEYKYVLDLNITKRTDLFPEELKVKKYFIRQAYLAFSRGMTTRVRYLEYLDRESTRKKKWFLTFKQKTLTGRVVEIEKKLDERDGKDLWDIAIGKLKKERYSFDHNDVRWEVDFFIKGDHYYFALAEAELEEGAPRPEPIDFLKPFVLHQVELDDDRFSNKRLGDVEFSTRIYHELTKDKYNADYDQPTQGIQPS